MDCPICAGKLRVTHTYRAGGFGQTRRAECLKCLKTVTLVTTIAYVDPGYGEGAAAVAKKMEAAAGEATPATRTRP